MVWSEAPMQRSGGAVGSAGSALETRGAAGTDYLITRSLF